MTLRTFPPRDPRPAGPARRRLLVLAAAGALAAAWPALRAHADVIPVRSAELRVEEGEVLLNAEFELSLNPTLEEALKKGVPLYFVLEVEITRPRWYWLDETVIGSTTTWRVAYAPLAQHYRVSTGLIAQTLNSIAEVERLVGRVTSRPIARVADFARGARYDAAVRLRLDVAQLPKPFQVDALASREWQLASDWQRFGFTP
ncbi:MAG TPA: DUF4390 domain-containing protein [Casimicrobiaceae bacterium]|jgi:hypothetical protein|nr:DUF4390 domain-containing protein [Casimicrobiaceae bacterium]